VTGLINLTSFPSIFFLLPFHQSVSAITVVGQMAVEHFGHTASLAGSFFISFVPIILFATAMPETMGHRGQQFLDQNHGEGKDFVPLA
jgi:hypothetical protein